jgi:hypothetical protein
MECAISGKSTMVYIYMENAISAWLYDEVINRYV